MNSDTKTALFTSWGVTDITNSTALIPVLLANAPLTGFCQGPSNYWFNGGYYTTGYGYRATNRSLSVNMIPRPVSTGVNALGQNTYADADYARIDLDLLTCQTNNGLTPQGCFYMPPSQSACLAQTACSVFYYNSTTGQQTCNDDPYQNGGNICALGNSYGQTTWYQST